LAIPECLLHLFLRARNERQDPRGNGRCFRVSLIILRFVLEISLTNEKSSSVSSTEDLAELAAIQEDVGLLRLLNGDGSVQAWNEKGEKGDMTTLEVSHA
jgi:hypothetical protein